MTRRNLRHFLALPVLIATLLCVALPAPALAQSGKGHGKNQRDDSGYQQSRDYRDDNRDDSDDQRGNGKGNKSDRGNSNQKHQSRDADYDYGRSRGDNSGRGNSNQQYRDDGDNYDNGRQAQQGRSLSPQDAAQRARSQYGGKVLKVQPAGQGFQVRLLKDDGRVVTVPIAD